MEAKQLQKPKIDAAVASSSKPDLKRKHQEVEKHQELEEQDENLGPIPIAKLEVGFQDDPVVGG